MSTENASTSTTAAPGQTITFRHEFGAPPAVPLPAAPAAPAGDPARVRIVNPASETDFRELSLEDFEALKAELVAEAVGDRDAAVQEARFQTAGRILKGLGINKAERDAVLKEILDPETDWALRTSNPYKLTKKDVLDALEKVRTEHEGAKGKLERYDAYEKHVSASVQKQWDGLPESARTRLEKRLPKDVDPLTKAQAIEDYLAERAELLAEVKAQGGDAGDKKAAEEAAAKAAAEEAEKKKPKKPGTTGSGAGPASPPAAGSLDKYQQWQSLEKMGQSIRAGRFYLQNKAEIEALRSKYE